MKHILFLLALFLFGCNSALNPPTPSDGPVVFPPLNHATGLLKDPKKRYGRVYWRPFSMYQAITNGDVPDSFDARDHGCRMPIKDQGGCGSCWAFGSTSTGEINYCIQTGNNLPASSPFGPQAAVSCDDEFYGCGGGLFTGKFNQTYGFFAEKDWPYTSGGGNTGRCDKNKLTSLKPIAKPKSFVYVGAPDRGPSFDEVTAAIAQFGAVSVSAGAGGDWESYGHDESQILTRCQGTSTNHEIAAIAYHKATQDITIQNSWGNSFGASGYMRIKWGCDSLTEDAGYFVFDGTPSPPPKIHLPAQYIVNAGDDVTLAIKAEANVTYEWFSGTQSLGTGSQVTILPTSESEYRLIAKNKGGEAEIHTLVSLKL